MRVRRVLGIFLAFVLVFSMAACGNYGNVSKTGKWRFRLSAHGSF